jgi:hypothetical protein
MIDTKRLEAHLKNGKVEYVMCAANYYDDGIDHDFKPYNVDKGFVVCGWRHPNAGETYLILNPTADRWDRCIEGFLTTKNRFLTRSEALELVKENGQLKDEIIGGELTSEDLW